MKPRAHAGLLLTLSSFALAACGEILNVDGIEFVDPTAAAGACGSAGTGGAGGGAPACEGGEFRCDGAALQLCDTDVDAFRTVRVCSSAALCCADPAACGGQPGCRAPLCAEGDFRCQGEVLQACNTDQTDFVDIDACASALHCNASLGRCTDAACDATLREQQCNGPNIEECLPGRSTWSPIDSCPSYGACAAGMSGSCAMPACRSGNAGNVPSPYICTGGNLMRCNDSQTAWEYVETCLNTANCNALLNTFADPFAPDMSTQQLEQLGCRPPSCAPGRYRCDGATLTLCGADRRGYVDRVDTCTSARHCNASAGRCMPAECTIGEHQCSGDEYQICTEGGWQLVETCSSGAPCDTARGGCQAPLCRPNEYRCNGVELERCNVERTGWIPVETCETSALCRPAAKHCEAPVCEPEARRCTPEGVIERCNSGRSGWDPIRNCAAAANLPLGRDASAVCDPSGADQCLAAAVCVEGALRCNDRELERCRSNAWHPHERCASAAQCDATAGACVAPICEPGGFRCVTRDQPPALPAEGESRLGLALQVCNSRGTGFDPVSACAALELCDEVHGQCDICDPAAPPLCAGDQLLLCTADGQEQTLYKRCTQGCVEEGTDAASRTTCREDLQMASSN